jgi:hypothetical protein
MHINALLRVSMLGVELRRLWVRNFKSLRDFSLDVESKFTAVTGPSGSGKTSLVEVFELWRDLVEYARGNAPNPFLKWWSYENAVWRGDVSQPIALGLELVAGDVRVRYELELYGRGADERVEVERDGARLEYSDGVLRAGRRRAPPRPAPRGVRRGAHPGKDRRRQAVAGRRLCGVPVRRRICRA